jgi:Neurotransmitter-gated ion-channel ligand binding domain
LVAGQFSSSCDIDVTWFPYDEQICNISFISWDSEDEVIITDFDRWLTRHQPVGTDRNRQRRDNDDNIGRSGDNYDNYDEYEDGWDYSYDDDNNDDRSLPVNNTKHSYGLPSARYDGEWKIVGKYLTTFTLD